MPATVSFASVFPVLTSRRDIEVAVQASLVMLLTTCGLFAASGVVAPLSHSIQRVVILGSAFTLVQGLYLIAITDEVRRGSYNRISWARLWNGTSNFLGTAVVSATMTGKASLVFPAAGSFAVSSLYLTVTRIAQVRAAIRQCSPATPGQMWRYGLRYWRAALSGLLAALAYQAGSFALLGLGRLAAAWSLVVRIDGGFATVARTVVAPVYEIEFSAGIRLGRRRAASRANRTGLLTGLVMGILVAAGVAGSLLVSGTLDRSQTRTTVIIIAASVLMTVGTLGPAVIVNNLVMLDGQNAQLVWALLKACLTVAAMFTIRSTGLLLSLAALESAFGVIYVSLVVRRLGRRDRLFGGDMQLVT